MDQLIFTIVIVVIYALSGWLQKKAEARQAKSPGNQDDAAPAPESGGAVRPAGAEPKERTPAPSPGLDWQRELRRLFEGNDAEPAPPPVAKQEPPAPETPPVMVRPKTPVPIPVMRGVEPSEGPATSRLSEAALAYGRAKQLHSEASAKFHQVVEQAKRRELSHTRATRRPVSPEIVSAVALARNPATMRQAVVASTIFGPPKGLEN